MIESILTIIKTWDPIIGVSVIVLLLSLYFIRLFMNYINKNRKPKDELIEDIFNLYNDVKNESDVLKKELSICMTNLNELKQDIFTINTIIYDLRYSLEHWSVNYPPSKQDIIYAKKKLETQLRAINDKKD